MRTIKFDKKKKKKKKTSLAALSDRRPAWDRPGVFRSNQQSVSYCTRVLRIGIRYCRGICEFSPRIMMLYRLVKRGPTLVHFYVAHLRAPSHLLSYRIPSQPHARLTIGRIITSQIGNPTYQHHEEVDRARKARPRCCSVRTRDRFSPLATGLRA